MSATTTLQTIWNTTYLDADTRLVASYRATAVVWQGADGTLELDAATSLTAGWFCAIGNSGTGALTVNCVGGASINGQASLMMQPGNSGLFVCDGTNFNSIGALVGALPIDEGGTGATTAPQALTNLGGTSVGQSIFTASSVAAVLALLGIRSAFTESTISISQSLAATDSNTVFVASAALTLTLPLTTSLTTSFYVGTLAQGGAVVIQPQATDAINGGGAGTALTVAQGVSLLLVTDIAGNWWTLFNSGGADLTVPGNLTVDGNATINGTITGLGTTPIGSETAFAGASAPTGWLLEYGQPISRTTYAALFAVIGTTYGAGDGSTTFNVPDSRGVVIAGVDNMGGVAANRLTVGGSGMQGNVLSYLGGNELLQAHGHTVADPGHTHGTTDPEHSHVVATVTAGGGTPSGEITGESGSAAPNSATENAATGIGINVAGTNLTVDNAGAGNFQNVQPTAMRNWIIFTGVA